VPKDQKPGENKSKESKPKRGKPKAPPSGRAAVVVPRPVPPIFINFTPTINSLSPVGAVVGGGDFTLTVLGSNFNANSVVNWNQTGRPTTVVSSTQLTAQIAAADISVVGVATLTVVNGGTGRLLTSNAVTFNVIPDITSVISQLQAIPQNPAALIADLNTWVTLEQAQVDALTTQVNNDKTTIASLNAQIQSLNNTVTQDQNTIGQLQAALAAAKGATASPLDVAQSFKNVVDQIQQQARDAGGVQTTLTNMNVQLKTLISVQPQSGTTPPKAILGFPDLTAPPDANLLSTMTLAFGAIPNVKPPSSAAPSVSSAPASAGIPSAPAPSGSPVTAASTAPASSTGGEASSIPVVQEDKPQPSAGESSAKRISKKKVRRSGESS
jgi:hypothetical protein